ncbi:MAG: 50S ribosomal protein L29 [Sulfobacillus thermosulfidooxidans]|uniref:Large ribosomal subunit protein uL29 n=1 Tax=Sulfobacillus thermotolerans TaxID=338644 RepID=A0ABN5GZ27_9FIRM|nr:50S ribosomal protein L29 [Sulfobacillus sp. hq2]AUW92946.1 50S ribosomal protein L29 [Sulfobacillus thermotolerans]MCY0907130.1 50S ribosomal protein L29 [Sulfobacillus thermotolerans]POB11191.1 50S ribosomal protein L29 [Sulfobacillus sp. hq2]PSR37232.1 MAG: 50S ribosomal protein L29 [Sulfobacillus thermosulfidooxidans]
MKPKEIRELSQDELAGKLRALKEELFRLRFQLATAQLENPMRVRQVRKDIARVHTIMHERQVSRDAD